jgi:hypothetical protein
MLWPGAFQEKVVAMRLVRTLAVTSLAAVVLALAAAPAGAQSTPILVDVRAGSHPGFDRVVFEFEGAVPEHTVSYVDQLVEDGSGNPVSVAGEADLEVVFHGANAHEEDGSDSVRSPRRFSPGLPAVKEIAQIGDFEAVVSYGIGVDQRRPIKVFTLSQPSRLVVDVSTTGSAGSTDDSGSLPFTGSRSRELLVTALALLASGAAALALARRTRTA